MDTHMDTVTEALRQRILDGEFGTGGRLPPVRMLAKEHKAGPDLINKILQRLQAEGLLISRGRTGVFVNKPRPRAPGSLAMLYLYMDRQGLQTVDEIIEDFSTVPAPEYVADAMGMEKDAPVVHRLRRLGTPTVHYCLIESFYPALLVGESILQEAHRDQQYDLLTAIKETHGKNVIEVHEDVVGRFPTPREQDLLEIVRGTPVQEVNRTYYAGDDKMVLLYSRDILVASYFVLSYDYAAPSS